MLSLCKKLASIYFLNFTFAYIDESPYWKLREKEIPWQEMEMNLTNSYFLNLRNYQVNARPATMVEYPWLARVIHSTENDKPTMCTAICIDNGIFITAARCVYILKIKYTSLMYQDTRLKPKAFVLPTNTSKQMFDDIGFIIVHVTDFVGMWQTVPLLQEKRTDTIFKWFDHMKFDDFEHFVIGYAKFKSDESTLLWNKQWYLTKLDVHVKINLCPEILIYHQRIDGFAVPCYHSCTLAQFHGLGKKLQSGLTICNFYHGSEGSALINRKTDRLMGIATWGAYFEKYELPVGFAIPNSDNFFEDKRCAEKIRNNDAYYVEQEEYQKLCDNK